MGITANIYDCHYGRDPLSVFPQETKEVVIVNVEGPFEPDEERPAVKLFFRQFGNRKTVHAAPFDEHGNQIDMTMKGYSFIDTSDSRVSRVIEANLGHAFYGAVALHDRKE